MGYFSSRHRKTLWSLRWIFLATLQERSACHITHHSLRYTYASVSRAYGTMFSNLLKHLVLSYQIYNVTLWASKMAQQVKEMLTSKPNHLSSIPRSHKVKEKASFPVLSSISAHIMLCTTPNK